MGSCAWLLSLGIMPSGLIRGAVGVSLPRGSGTPQCVNIWIRSSADGHVGCSHLLPPGNTECTQLETRLQLLWVHRRGSLTHVATLGFGSGGIFSVFRGGSVVLCSCQCCTRVQFLMSPTRALSFFLFRILVPASVLCVGWWVLICFSLMTNDVEHLFMSSGCWCVFPGEVSVQACHPSFSSVAALRPRSRGRSLYGLDTALLRKGICNCSPTLLVLRCAGFHSDRVQLFLLSLPVILMSCPRNYFQIRCHQAPPLRAPCGFSSCV